MPRDPERTPVIVGVGQLNDRPERPEAGMNSLQLMAAALRRAEADAGVPLLRDLDMLAVVDQISFRELGELSAPLAAAIGAAPAIACQSPAPHGDTPIRFLNEAANRIGAGEVRLAAVAGGEALRTAAARADAEKPSGDKHDIVRFARHRRQVGYAQSYGLVAPVDIYPLYENAGRAAYGQTLAEAQAESAQIWSLFSQVAAENEGAWIRNRATPEEILTPSARNRPLAFPYTKLMVANSAVNQGAGFIVASLAEARRRGVPDNRLIHVGLGAGAKEDHDFLKRDRYDRSVSMDLCLRRALELNGLSVADLDLVELYSCFPCVPKMARRTLGWPADRPASVFGGLTFGGGPIANYMSHAVVSMAERLRREGRFGLLFANGGYATDNHVIVVSSRPIEAARFPQDFDLQAEAERARAPVPELDPDHLGEAVIETYTVFHGRAGELTGGVVVARTPQGGRTLAHVDAQDPAMLAFLTDGRAEPVGTPGHIEIREPLGRIWAR